MKNFGLIKWVFSISVLFSEQVVCQEIPFEIKQYPFLRYEFNKLEMYGNQDAYNHLFDKFTRMGLKGEGKIRIVQIGDSHLQADFFSGYFRKRLQTYFLGANGGRGFIFPYKVAGTNNPLNYSVSSKGTWNPCRNIDSKRHCPLGVSGIAITTADTNAYVTIQITDPQLPGYDFDRLMVFHSFGSECYKPDLQINTHEYTRQEFPELGYTLFEFKKNLEKVSIGILKESPEQKRFALHGVNFESTDAGIIYHTIGVNGATLESFLGCEWFKPHLQALNPDWVIISLGTNDSFSTKFDSILFIQHIDTMIQWVSEALPNAALLFTTPGDNSFKNGQVNENAEKASRLMVQRVKEKGYSIWDFYQLMGGKGSMYAWRSESLAHTDYIHLTQKGYEYQGEMLFNAFLKAYDEYISFQFMKK